MIARKRYARRFTTVLAMTCLLIGVWWLYGFMTQTDDTPTESAVLSREYAEPRVTNKPFETPAFYMELPEDWQLKEQLTSPFTVYKYQATKKTADNRWFDVYIGATPDSLAFNRLRPVAVTDAGLQPVGQVSDNCYEAAGSASKTIQTFAGVQFQCDLGNYARNVVGVGAPGQSTKLKIDSQTFTIVYTDHNVRPDYQILDNMLKSFRAK